MILCMMAQHDNESCKLFVRLKNWRSWSTLSSSHSPLQMTSPTWGKEMRQTNSKSIGQYVDCRCKSPLGQKNAAALFSRSLLVWVAAVFSSSVIHYFMHLKLLSWSDKKKCWYYLNANSFLVQVPPIGGCSSSASHPSAVVLLWPRGRFSTWDDSSRPRSWLSKYCWGAESLGTYTRPPQRAFCCIRLHASHFARCIFEGFVWR